jgi:hypothetical protein
MLTDGRDPSGLEMAGLPESTQNLCRRLHSAFLERHDFKSWPVRVALAQRESVPNSPELYLLEFVCGTKGKDAISFEHLTPHLEVVLRQGFRFLEIHHEMMAALQNDFD